MSDQPKQQIYEAMSKVMTEVSHISKDRKNTAQNYAFRGIDDVFEAFHAPLAKHGVFYVPEVLKSESVDRPTKSGGSMTYTTLTVAYTFFAPDGSSVRAVVVGEASDSGDKSSNKAMSAALKYALLQIFCVPTSASDDADADSPEFAPRATSIQPANQTSNSDTAEIKSLKQEVREACIALGYNKQKQDDALSRLEGRNKEQIEMALRALKQQRHDREVTTARAFIQKGFQDQQWDETDMSRYLAEKYKGRALNELSLDELIAMADDLFTEKKTAPKGAAR